MNIGIYIYEQAEVLDFAGPFEVFSTASRVAKPPAPFHVFLIGETDAPITARGGFGVSPTYTFQNHPELDILMVPGGIHTEEIKKPTVLDWIARESQLAQIVASVCTGAFLLAEAGVLATQHVTTHWQDIPDLRKAYPNLTVLESKRWMDEGRIITSAGISAGIDMSLHLVSRLADRELAIRTAKQMDFSWDEMA